MSAVADWVLMCGRKLPVLGAATDVGEGTVFVAAVVCPARASLVVDG
ncbi:hypothetical protein [Streptomyces sp. MNP-20]|nr:hypothetical protein [Streptomyces sp. MNP-20]